MPSTDANLPTNPTRPSLLPCLREMSLGHAILVNSVITHLFFHLALKSYLENTSTSPPFGELPHFIIHSEMYSMFPALPKGFSLVTRLLSLALTSIFILPFSVMADPKLLSCQEARLKSEQTQEFLRQLEQRQHHLQQKVRSTFRKLLVCQKEMEQTLIEPQQCDQLKDKGPKYFQAMVETTTRKHKASKQLAHQTVKIQLNCLDSAVSLFPDSEKSTQLTTFGKFRPTVSSPVTNQN